MSVKMFHYVLSLVVRNLENIGTFPKCYQNGIIVNYYYLKTFDHRKSMQKHQQSIFGKTNYNQNLPEWN